MFFLRLPGRLSPGLLLSCSSLYSLPIAATADYHKPSGLKQHTFIILQFWESEVPRGFHWAKPRCQQESHLSGGSGGNSLPCLFQLLEASCLPCLWAPPSTSKAHASL